MLLSLNEIKDLLPLFLGWVNTSGVVSADVQEDNAFVLCAVQVLHQASEVESLGLLVEVAVLLAFHSYSVGDGLVDWPCGVGHVNFSALDWVELRKEFKA